MWAKIDELALITFITKHPQLNVKLQITMNPALPFIRVVSSLPPSPLPLDNSISARIRVPRSLPPVRVETQSNFRRVPAFNKI